MKTLRPTPKNLVSALALSALLTFAAGCKSTPAPIVSNANGSPTTSDGSDGNLAYANGSSAQPARALGSNASYTPTQSSETYTQQQPAPIVQGGDYSDQNYSYNAPPTDETQSNDADYYAQQPPPPLPDYDQPPPPDSNYIWTPGYWAYGSGGYYWVPGTWCPPPYYGALWTPPYWGYYNGRYAFHHGYWGPHVGFYGGIDYGFGYIGIGYFGGYWRGNDFYYNRAVTNVGHVNNVYDRRVTYNNVNYSARPSNRVSYNGGRGGINVAPRPAELAARTEPHARPVEAQQQVRQASAQNRQQFYSANHGRPAEAAVARPVPNARIAATPRDVQQVQQRGAQQEQRNSQEKQRTQQQQVEQQHNTQQQQQRVQQQQRNDMQRPQQPQQEARPQTPQTVAPRQEQQARPQPQARPEQQPRTEAQPRPAPQQARPAPEARPAQEARPAPQQAPRPAPEARPAPQQAPRPAPEARPAPQSARPAPTPHPSEAPHEAPHEEHPK
jgi:hypothetical protein